MFRIACVFAGVLWFAVASAEGEGFSPEAAMAVAIEAVSDSLIAGPTEVRLGEQGVLKLSADYLFIPVPAASRYMEALGNNVDDRFMGLVMPAGEADWMVVVEYESSGYVEDDDAKDWNADDLLDSLKQGTAAANEFRREHGYPELEVIGWVEQPNYDADSHRLVWSMSARQKGAAEGEEPVINYNTYALGREGYFTLNLITGLGQIAQDKPVAGELLSSLEYNPGKRYSDFDASTDHVAEYGLAALVTGVAAKKLGLLAVIGAFIAKFFKVFLLVGAGAIAGAAKLFGRKKG